MSTARRLHHSYEEYLDALQHSAVKLEYCDGEIYAMAGGTPVHADLAASILRILGNALGGRCRVSSSDLKVRIEQTDLTTFTDATVVCGERQYSGQDRHAVINPTLLVEVTSPSTEDYDRGEKLRNYQELPSLKALLFVSHSAARVTVVERNASGWEHRDFTEGEEVWVSNLDLRFPVAELYRGIKPGDG